MIGFVEVEISSIKKAYSLIKDDINNQSSPSIDDKIKNLSRIINNDAGKKQRMFSHKEKLKVKALLHELVYSSYVSTSERMLLRVEVASLIQYIISLHEGKGKDKEWVSLRQLKKTSVKYAK